MTNLDEIFENQPKLISAKEASRLIGYSRDTLYDMKYRPEKYQIPEGMIFKNGKRFLVRTDLLKKWFINRCA